MRLLGLEDILGALNLHLFGEKIEQAIFDQDLHLEWGGVIQTV